MKEEKDYIKDITEIRSMMERSTKFLSLSGLAGVMAGLYALAGAYFAYMVLNFKPDRIIYNDINLSAIPNELMNIFYLAISILILSVGTAIILSSKNANKKSEKVWNSTSKRLLVNMVIPLFVGGLLILMLINNGLIGLIAPFSLLFYGLALFAASKFTYDDIKNLGLIQISLGLISAFFVEYSLLLWAIGFGLMHIIYGIYIHYKYE